MNQNDYFNYLKTRSNFGFFYRKYFLYPILDFFLKKPCLDVGCGLGDFFDHLKGPQRKEQGFSNERIEKEIA